MGEAEGERRSVNNLNAATATELFCAGDKKPISLNIIAVSFHHHHEITRTFQIEQHLGFSSAVAEETVQRIDRFELRDVEWQADPHGTRELGLDLVEG